MDKAEQALIKALRELEIPTHIKGYQYIKDAVAFITADVSILQRMTTTKGLYPQVALKWNTTPERVERGIRHAIEQMQTLSSDDARKRILGTDRHLSNGAFLGALAEYLRMGEVA